MISVDFSPVLWLAARSLIPDLHRVPFFGVGSPAGPVGNAHTMATPS
jgi:hypothetical protein